MFGCDLDGCVYAFDEAARSLLRVHGLDVPAEPSAYWSHLKDQVPHEAWEWMWGPGRRKLFGGGHAHPGAVETLRQLESRVRIIFITHRPIDCADVTLRWLADQRLHPYGVMHVAGENKGEAAPRCDFYVEDRDIVANEIHETTGSPVLLPRRPWNTSAWDDVGIIPFDEWTEVAQWVETNL